MHECAWRVPLRYTIHTSSCCRGSSVNNICLPPHLRSYNLLLDDVVGHVAVGIVSSLCERRTMFSFPLGPSWICNLSTESGHQQKHPTCRIYTIVIFFLFKLFSVLIRGRRYKRSAVCRHFCIVAFDYRRILPHMSHFGGQEEYVGKHFRVSTA